MDLVRNDHHRPAFGGQVADDAEHVPDQFRIQCRRRLVEQNELRSQCQCPGDSHPLLTLTVKVPGETDGFGGRVITGVARDQVAGQYTPLALAVPAQLVVQFDIEWA